MSLPAASTLSVARSALVPSSVTTLPFTRTWPLRMSCSAWRREAIPARAISFCKRSRGMKLEIRKWKLAIRKTKLETRSGRALYALRISNAGDRPSQRGELSALLDESAVLWTLSWRGLLAGGGSARFFGFGRRFAFCRLRFIVRALGRFRGWQRLTFGLGVGRIELGWRFLGRDVGSRQCRK